ncbi:FimV/HubP family polar landmark protein [Montanilutibacter psychrotolerans]|uniref:FimV/HubP family polar landmark protein n=1 Tax=Montanilutibacter psychrotolerans TaxID=1327343 RepID=UPI0016814716|nr:FimV/HubP family polar landmark protein [Lysobacter psychrotolerans]
MKSIARYRPLKMALALVLAAASGSAAALGLGQIELKSRLGQPLLAEIPIISSDPAELEQLQANLASPDTFARIGLRPPEGIVARLRFSSALDAAGNPVIRVTTDEPVDQPLLTFLIEVDWGQGRLVREYSALIDTPRTVSAPSQPVIEAPVVGPSNAIVREPELQPADPGTVAAEALANNPQAPGTTPDATPEPVPVPGADNAIPPTQPEPLPASAPLAMATPPATPAPSLGSDGQYAVQRGDSLSRIAGQLGLDGTLDQSMIALLRANPDAFIDGNINQLKAGVVLRVPGAGDLAGIESAQATAIVRSQVQEWRGNRRAVPQPVSADTGASPAAVASAAPAGQAGGARRSADARLEIVPPGASDATRAGTQSGMTGGGGGEMLRQELQQKEEALVAREAELAEMKARVAELEKLQQQQQQLLAMKDTELAAVQQRLGASQAAQPAPPAANWMPWLLGGGSLLAALLLGGWWMRRRSPATPSFRAPAATAGSSSLADAFPLAVAQRPDLPIATSDDAVAAPLDDALAVQADAFDSQDVADLQTGELLDDAGVAADAGDHELADRYAEAPQADDEPVVVTQAAAPVPAPAPELVAAAPAAQLQGEGTLPFWDRRDREVLPSKRAPTWHSGPTAQSDESDSSEGGGYDRLELARAYLNLGDLASARQLLGEVVVNGDLAARQQATRMLRDLE